jgi:hypothetical protein
MKRVFGRSFGINDIRKAFSTKVLSATPAEMLRMSELQGHSMTTALLYYTRTENE